MQSDLEAVRGQRVENDYYITARHVEFSADPQSSGSAVDKPVRLVCLLTAVALPAEPSAPNCPRTWPQAYSVQHDEPAGLLRLCTSYYTVEQDLRKGGAITRIALTHGKATNLLVEPWKRVCKLKAVVSLQICMTHRPRSHVTPMG